MLNNSWGRQHPRRGWPSAAALGLLISLLLLACGQEAPPRAARPTGGPAATATPAPAAQPAVRENDRRTMGDPAAPVRVVIYSDFQCPFCAEFVRDTAPQLIETYVETGKVQLVYRDLPLTDIHPSAHLAAQVANCAAEQGQFWPMHDRLFAGTSAGEWIGDPVHDRTVFLGYASELVEDRAALEACVSSNTPDPLIARDMQEASELGVRSTPTFVVNGRLLVGAQPFSVWRQTLEAELEAPPRG